MKKIKPEYITKSKETRMHNMEIPIIGLTGGIATGKSSCSQILKDEGYPIICADQLIKKIYKKLETQEFIKTSFPQAFADNEIDFKALRKIAFANEQNRLQLENFLYQFLPEAFREEFLNLGSPEFVIYDVPLLFEKGLDQKLDQTICVYAPKKTQIKRLIQRDQISEELALEILSSQIDIELKKEKSNFVIENGKELDLLKQATLSVFDQIFH